MERKTLCIKPAEDGLVVRDPRTMEPLPSYGKVVPDTSFWRRRLRDGGVEKTTAEAIANGVKAAQAAQTKAKAAEAKAKAATSETKE
ncbi:DUF2635 domain-containing protein [Pseudodesulfovibrio indicus]|uniref:Uncharacterized protein DUF2635 n=1 Tax=Pseudodesulfovibrio indicus TaxID=1716143 RepID=A0A140D8Y2_9BACT|nr:DUF2635 domain-containing protein [Pseudodesulfovibrio indicus]AMK09649.1 hypothetical protein AWY79_00265 [Pseudodesulfovibrio indicus]TDT86399.1 uncharacterized protein DUF2635 [Pseudodesulfovibrio indicus]